MMTVWCGTMLCKPLFINLLGNFLCLSFGTFLWLYLYRFHTIKINRKIPRGEWKKYIRKKREKMYRPKLYRRTLGIPWMCDCGIKKFMLFAIMLNIWWATRQNTIAISNQGMKITKKKTKKKTVKEFEKLCNQEIIAWIKKNNNKIIKSHCMTPLNLIVHWNLNLEISNVKI